MFEKFTREARQVVTAAVREAESRDDTRIGTEHLLLGIFDSSWPQVPVLESLGLTHMALLRALDEIDGSALEAVGIDPALIDAYAMEDRFPKGRRRRHIPFTGAARDVLKGALEEALALDHRSIGAEHIVLALTALPPQDRTTRILKGMGLEPAEVRSALWNSLRRAS
jgi:hypothetical protein